MSSKRQAIFAMLDIVDQFMGDEEKQELCGQLLDHEYKQRDETQQLYELQNLVCEALEAGDLKAYKQAKAVQDAYFATLLE